MRYIKPEVLNTSSALNMIRGSGKEQITALDQTDGVVEDRSTPPLAYEADE